MASPTTQQLQAEIDALTARVAALESLMTLMLNRWQWLVDTNQSHYGGYAWLQPLPPWW